MSKLTVIEQATEYLELSQKRMVYDESTHIIGSLLSLLEEKDSIGFWQLHDRYEEKVSKCLDQADEIKRLNGILEEKDKALEKCFMAGNSLASVVMGYELPEGHEEWSHQTANAYFYDTYYNDRKSAYEGYETWLAWKEIHDVSREITSSNNEGDTI